MCWVTIEGEDAIASSKGIQPGRKPVLLVYHITIDNALSLLLLAASAAIIVADVRTRERNDRQAELQHAAFELGILVALDRTPASA